MPTTIQISDEIKKALDRMKLYKRESYNEVIERIIEDDREINEKTKKEIEEARKGKSIPHEEVKNRFGL